MFFSLTSSLRNASGILAPILHLRTAQPKSEGITTTTHLEFGRTTYPVANILRPNCEARDGEVVTIIAQSDTILCHAIVAELVRADLIVRVFHRD
jgi:hypothetical protein